MEQQRLIRQRNMDAAKALKAQLQSGAATLSTDSLVSASTDTSTSTGTSTDTEPPVDTVRLWEPGARERYYTSKFGIGPEEVDAMAQDVARAYVEGLCWVLAYYYRGCPSWRWFFPYHYAPFAADLCAIADWHVAFTPGQPFRPFDQLMAVLPAASRVHVPPPFHPLMTDPLSPIHDFYPTRFALDLNGKRATWQGVALLPFIDEDRLLAALDAPYALLTPGEGVLNLLGMRTLGREGLDGLNSGRSAASSTTINVAVHVQGGGGGGGGGSGGTPDLAAVRRAAEMGVLDALRNKPGYRDQVRSLLK